MRQVGEVELSPLQLKKSPYTVRKVKRGVTWVFNEGVPSYRLIDPKGQEYIMQSYSTQKFNQSLESLASLKEHLKLPNGWEYKVIVLDRPLRIAAADGYAQVLQDDFGTTYTQIP